MEFLFNISSLDGSISAWWNDRQYWGEVCRYVDEDKDPETHQNHERDCLASCPVHSQ